MKHLDFSPIRFLLIDDSASMRRIIRMLLHTFGAREIVEAEDGASGFEAFIQTRPDVLLLDWLMPVFDGLELTQMIRSPGANHNPYVPIIMLTGHAEKKRVLAARDCGVTEFLAKPVSAQALYDRIFAVAAYPRPFIKTKTYFGPDRRRLATVGHAGAERRRQMVTPIRIPPLIEMIDHVHLGMREGRTQNIALDA